MDTWHYIVIGASILLLGFVVGQEYRRRNKRYLALRIIASVITVGCLACVALPIAFNHYISPSDDAIILTNGYSQDSVEHFLEAVNKNTPVFTPETFIEQQKNYRALHVFGYGLSADELSALHNTPVIFHPSNIGTGLTNISWKQTLQPGEKLRVQGGFTNMSATPVKLLLNGLNTFLDSVNIPANTTQSFELSTLPKQSGKAVYNITAIANSKVIEDELVPVEITQQDSLKVMILATSPDFENRFLKNWLSQNSCQVIVRTATSKEKYEREFLNTPSVNFDRITSPLLEKLDVLISDAASFSALSKDEQMAVQARVEDGLGLIIKTDTTLLSSAFYAAYFPVYTQQAKQQQAVSLKFASGETLHVLPFAQTLYIRKQPGIQAIVTDSSLQAVVSNSIYGSGKVMVTTFNDSYNWMLAGNKDSYYSFWSALLDKAAKNKNTYEEGTFSPAMPRVNQLLHTTFTNTGSSVPQPILDESAVYLRQNDDLPFEWAGSYWPVQTGWQSVKTQTNTNSLYIYGPGDWQYIAATDNLNITKQYVLQHENLPANAGGLDEMEQIQVPKIYFFIAFIICCTFLWVEKKFNG